MKKPKVIEMAGAMLVFLVVIAAWYGVFCVAAILALLFAGVKPGLAIPAGVFLGLVAASAFGAIPAKRRAAARRSNAQRVSPPSPRLGCQ